MFLPRLNNCVDCTTIPSLLNNIDCKMTELAKNQYNNTIFMLNYPVPSTVFSDLINYKRILTYKYCNPNYACAFTVENIASRIKLLIYK